MTTQETNRKSFLKLAQIHHCVKYGPCPSSMIEKVLKKEGDINYKIPSNSCADSKLIGNTALHIAAIGNDIELCRLLLKKGADFAIQNPKGHTVLHSSYYLEKPNRKIIDNILAIHVEIQDPANPTDEDGLSYFHIACIYNQLHVVEYFLKKGVSVDMAIKPTSKKSPGYAPLHIAAEGLFLSLLKLLLRYKANMNVKNAQGLTPFQILLKKKIDMLDQFFSSFQEGVPNYSIAVIDDLMNLLIKSNDVNDIGLTPFHIACTRTDLSDVEYISMLEQNVDLDLAVKMDSPIFPGYTALHFAAHCNFNIALMLMRRGANPQAKDANSVTPMDLFWKNQKPGNIHMLILEYWDYVTFNDRETSLIHFYDDTSSPHRLKHLSVTVPDITMTIGEVPDYWAGRTLLHFAVMFCKNIETIRCCMEGGLNVLVDAPDFHGVTPIHLAFRMKKLDVVDILLKNCENSINFVDNEGLSYLHIACSLDKNDYVGKFCQDDNYNMAYYGTSTYGFVTPGSTPLHVAMANRQNPIIYDLLTTTHTLERGLDFEAKNEKGLTPLDLFLRLRSDDIEPICNILVSSARLTNSMLEKVGLSKLHLAIYCEVEENHWTITRENINSVINCQDSSSIWYQFNGYTPLQLAIKKYCSVKIVKLLLEKGADIVLQNQQGDMPLYTALTNKLTAFPAMDLIVESLQFNQILRNQIKEQSGITMLHIFCHILKLNSASWLLAEKSDINARVKSECPIWSGYTPLHVLIKSIKSRDVDENMLNILKILLSSGADLTAVDKDGLTPIHLAMQDYSPKGACTVIAQLVENLPVTLVNPVDRTGMSHFHVACLINNVEKVKWFLENKLVDVNQPIDFFATKFAGERPLHLAVDHTIAKCFNLGNQQETVELLLKHGADIMAEDNYGHTALHKAVLLKNCTDAMESLLRRGADLEARNVFGQTPFEIIARSEQYLIEAIKFFEKRGCGLNNCNPYSEEGYLSMLISRRYHKNYMIVDFTPITQVIADIIDRIDSYETDDIGRNLIHNFVTTNQPSDVIMNYSELIEKAKAAWVDIDHQDKKGRTPLHLAAIFGNNLAVKALLHGGADINILDSENKTAFEYALEFYEHKKLCSHYHCHRRVIVFMTCHVAKLHDLNLKVHKNNIDKQILATKQFFSGPNDFYKQDEMITFLKKSQEMVIDEQTNLLIYDFMTEMGRGIIAYPFMTDLRREKVDRFFRQYKGVFQDISAVIYMKAVRRVRLAKLVANLLSAVAGSNVPIVCVEMIFQYLTNDDLENFIKATSKI